MIVDMLFLSSSGRAIENISFEQQLTYEDILSNEELNAINLDYSYSRKYAGPCIAKAGIEPNISCNSCLLQQKAFSTIMYPYQIEPPLLSRFMIVSTAPPQVENSLISVESHARYSLLFSDASADSVFPMRFRSSSR